MNFKDPLTGKFKYGDTVWFMETTSRKYELPVTCYGTVEVIKRELYSLETHVFMSKTFYLVRKFGDRVNGDLITIEERDLALSRKELLDSIEGYLYI